MRLLLLREGLEATWKLLFQSHVSFNSLTSFSYNLFPQK